jgi:NADPH-dependent 2,4-dienoyl-CoA reductase/sulfur reductase-like enzyme/rhodanese-related sulfurtransferase
MKVAIIGGMALGCKTAARLRRLMPDADITIFEKKPIISFGTCGMPFFTAGDIDDFNELMKTPWGSLRDSEYFRKVKAIDVRNEVEVIRIDPQSNSIQFREINSGTISDYSYDYLVLGMGAGPINAPYPMPQSPDISTYHSPFDALKLRKLLQKGEIGSVVIIGGGYVGCELAEALTSLWGAGVTIIEKEAHLMPGILDADISSLLSKNMEENGIVIRTGEKVKCISSNEDGGILVDLENSGSIGCDHVVNCLGIAPNIRLIHGTGIKIDEFGAIEVDSQLRTNINNIFAGGDIIRVHNLVSGQPSYFPLGSLANRQGRVIADNIAGTGTEFIGAVGTSSIKVFGMTFGSAGLNLKQAWQLSSDVGSVVGCWSDRPDYMPDGKNIYANLIYCRKTQRVLGFQIAGKGELTRYLDSMSIYLSQDSRIEDLLSHEHAYTPPHSQALNPLNHLAAMALADIKDGIHQSKIREDAQVIDLRDSAEIEGQPPPCDTIAIPFEELRFLMGNIDKSRHIQLLCQKGPRAFESAYLLKSSGFNDLSYIGGGVQLINSILDKDVE